jgi:hypothetical protein
MTDKVTLTNLVNLQNETTAVNAINTNNQIITLALDNTLSRDGTSPNQMGANLDMNSNHILNLPTPTSNFDAVRLADITTIGGGGSITVNPLPTGGTVNQALIKNSSTNFDASWKTTPGILPTGGAATQVLSKVDSTDFNTSWINIPSAVPVVTPEQFGYTTYGSGDAGSAINAAIASTGSGLGNGVRIDFGPHTYNIVTPILANKFSIWLKGQGDTTTLNFAPTGNNQTMITYNVSPTITGSYYGRITDMRIVSADVSFVKTAINLVDVGDMEVSGLVIGPLWQDNSHNSVCLQINGRQTSSFHDLRLFGDKPIIIKANPNSASISADHFHFWNLSLMAASANPCITVDSNVVFSNTVFDGFQAWVLGTYGFYYNGTTAPARGCNLSISNVRTEGGSSPTAYSIYLNATGGGIAAVNINNCIWDSARKGLFARSVLGLTLGNIYFPPVVSTEAINVDNTCQSVLINNCRWESPATQNIGTLTTKYSYNFAGVSATVPANALYSI